MGTQFMLILPRSINKSLDPDIQALILNKDITFDTNKESTKR